MKQRDLVIIFGSSCALVLLWIIFTLIHTSNTSTVSEVVITSVKPIPDSFDASALEKVKARMQVAPVYSLTTNVNPSPTPAVGTRPTLTPTPSQPGVTTATNSAGVQI